MLLTQAKAMFFYDNHEIEIPLAPAAFANIKGNFIILM